MAWPFHRRLAHGTTLGCFLAAFATSAFAAEPIPVTTQPPPAKELRLEDLVKLEIPTVETASRYSQNAAAAPASVSVITADDVKKYGYRTLADILESVRGMQVTYNRDYSFLGVRGFNRGDYNNRLLVLVDGHRINNSLSGGAFIGTDFILDVDLIEKVEIIRGPGSSLYGNNAFFGVVNVITRKAQDFAGAEVSGEAASFDTYKGRASYGRKFKNGLEMLFSGSWYNSEGPDNIYFKHFDQPANNNGIAHEVDDDSYRSVFGSMSWYDLSLEGAFNTREKGVPTGIFGTEFNDPRTRTTDDRSFVNLKFAHEFPEVAEVTAQIYYDRHDSTDNSLFDFPPETLNVEKQQAQWWGFDFQAKKVFLERHVLLAGAEYRQDFIQTRRNFDAYPPSAGIQNSSDTYNYGVYLEGDATVATNLHVNAGFRYDQYGHTDATVNPRVALIYNPWEKGTLKAIRGHAFRAPNYFERMFNPSLLPETIISDELVYEEGIGNHIRSSVSGFYNQIDHLINFQGGTYENVAGSTSRGLELELLGSFWPSGLRGRVSYTLQDTEFHQAGVPRSDSPRHLGKFNLIAPLWPEKIFAGVEFQYTSKRLTLQGTEAAGFGVVNLTLFSQNLYKGLEISGSVYNLLDRHYDDPATHFIPEDLVPRDGRSFRVKLTYRF